MPALLTSTLVVQLADHDEHAGSEENGGPVQRHGDDPQEEQAG